MEYPPAHRMRASRTAAATSTASSSHPRPAPPPVSVLVIPTTSEGASPLVLAQVRFSVEALRPAWSTTATHQVSTGSTTLTARRAAAWRGVPFRCWERHHRWRPTPVAAATRPVTTACPPKDRAAGDSPEKGDRPKVVAPMHSIMLELLVTEQNARSIVVHTSPVASV